MRATEHARAPGRPLSHLFGLVEIGALLHHEEIQPDRLKELRDQIRGDGYLENPILVDRTSLVILDGHHRVRVLKGLGCSLIPAYLVDYGHPAISVHPWRPGDLVDKSTVIRRGLSRAPLPPRTSRHVIELPLSPHPIPLERLVESGPRGLDGE